jgi:hypothetical protein
MAPSTDPSLAPLLPHDERGTGLAMVPPSPMSSPRSSSYASSTLSTTRPALRRTRSRARAVQRTLSFATALLAALCAGSITVFSLYGPVFQSRLHYTQPEVNGVAIAASVALYLPVPLMGYACDRVGPAPLSGVAAVLFGAGYGLAAAVYRKVAAAGSAGGDRDIITAHINNNNKGLPLMRLAFVLVGAATCSMYLAAVATCAKTFGRGRHRGLALALPIAAFGLSGMWESQLGSRLLGERDADGNATGEVDVFRFFVFLAVLLSCIGLLGVFTLRIVDADEEELIEEAVNELERSGVLLDGSALFTPGRATTQPGRPATPGNGHGHGQAANGTTGMVTTTGGGGGGGYGYGAIERSDPFEDIDDDATERERRALLDPAKDTELEDANDDGDEEARLKKQWVLNAETRRFLADHTMWFLALGFFFMIGPGEAFINNMGTVIKTLYPPELVYTGKPTSAATHVSIVGITSTVARLLTGTLTDLLAPSPHSRTVQMGGGPTNAPAASDSDADSLADAQPRFFLLSSLRLPSVSRVTFLLAFALVLSAGLVTLASGVAQDHGGRFWVVSGLVGAGYGAVFSLTPIIITVIWGVENFATNWGIVAMFPALGATVWGSVYSRLYELGAAGRAALGHGQGQHHNQGGPGGGGGDGDDTLCYGSQCYTATFWAMAGSVWLACLLVLWAWKGRNGWSQRGIVV